MIHIENIFNQIHYLLESSSFLMMLFIASISLKLYILISVFRRRTTQTSKIAYYSLIGVLIGSLVQDTEWAFMLFKKIFLDDMELRFFMFWRRMSWAAVTIQYQSLSLLLESLAKRNFRLSLRHKFFMFISTLTVCFFVGTAFIDYDCLRSTDKHFLEFLIQKFTNIYSNYVLMISSLFLTLWELHKRKLPQILLKQLNLLFSDYYIAYLLPILYHFSIIFFFTNGWLFS